MVTGQMNDSYPPFEYGSSVLWRRSGQRQLIGSVCGFDVVTCEEKAKAVGYPLGTVLALVEEGSGRTFEVAIEELELL